MPGWGPSPVFGGFALGAYPRLAWLHVPTVIWGTLVNLTGWVCPLTPLENWLRDLAGQSGYEGDFIGYSLVPVIYSEDSAAIPGELLGLCLGAWSLAVYGWVWRRRRAA